MKFCCRLFRVVGCSLQPWSAVRSDLGCDCKMVDFLGFCELLQVEVADYLQAYY